MTALALIDGLEPGTSIQSVKHLAGGVHLVREVMASGKWMTIYEVQQSVNEKLQESENFAECTISARIRDQRKTRHGGHEINRRKQAGKKNTYEYQLILNIGEVAA